jgi:site-specific DNA-methyltransferase (adenine-specific)
MDSSVYTDKRSEVRKQPLSEVFNEDCMLGMARYPDKYFDLAIVDPPYGIGEDGRNNHTRGKLAKAKDYRSNSRYDNATPDADYFFELFRVSKHQILWGGNYFIQHLDNTPCFIVWDKNNGDNDFADCELAWASFETACRRFKWTWNGMLQENMKAKEERIHPNHKPIALYKWLLKNYGKPGDKILDTHLGSGSSRIAAYDMGFDFTAFELDKDYFHAQEERFQKHIKQLNLFAPVPQSNKGTQLKL